MMEEQLKPAIQSQIDALREGKELAEKIVNTVREPMLVLHPDLRVHSGNESFYAHFQVDPGETEGKLIYELGNNQWDIPELRTLLENVLPENKTFNDFLVEHEFESLGRRKMLLNARRIDSIQFILLAIEDVTDREHTKVQLERLNKMLEEQTADRLAVIRLLQSITRAANEATTVEQGFHEALRLICHYNDWEFGQVWQPNRNDPVVFTTTTVCYTDHKDYFAPYRRVSERTRMTTGRGLIGRVMATGKMQWSENINDLEDFSRGEPEELPVGAAVAFPVRVDHEIVAILEFCSSRPLEREEEFLRIMPDVGIQLGHVVQRKRMEQLNAHIVDQERQRLGRELHDSVSQQVTAAKMMAENLHELLEAGEAPTTATTAALVATIDEATRQVRAVMRGLLPVEVEAEGLRAALEKLVTQIDEQFDVACAFECPDQPPTCTNFVATQLFLVAREAVYNAVKYADADRLVVALHNRGQVKLEVRDDGVGFDPAKLQATAGGLNIMRYRADLIRASLTLKSAPGEGTLVTCVLTLTDPP